MVEYIAFKVTSMRNNTFNKFLNVTDKIQGHPIVSTIRNGLVNMIPILIIGAFALTLNTFPVEGNYFLNY